MKTTDTITVTVDGHPIEARPGELLIEVAKRAGVYIPYFCYHPRMDPVGACRMCLVAVQPGPPKPQTACTTRVTDGMTVETQFTNPDINKAQQGILELLLINHPLDCPICDRGGECPLQDQTQDYGPNESKFIEPKRRFRKPVPISPLVNLDRERCILCYRCTRFCEELSGDTLIGVVERGPKAYIFPFADEAFDSYFSGNTVQICPVGALTSAEYRFNARPWDLQTVPSTCNMCSSGCALHVQVRTQDGNVVRFSGGTNEETNEEWLCDKGRYGHAYISAPERLTQPLVRTHAGLSPVSWDEAFRVLRERLGGVVAGDGSAGVIAGESLCDEDYYTAQKFARAVLQTNNVDHRLEGGMGADALMGPQLTYDDVLGADLVTLVSFDPREEVPVLFLRFRIAATKRGLRFAIVHPREIALSEFAGVRVPLVPGKEAAAAANGELTQALQEAQRPVILLGPRVARDAAALRAWSALADRTGARISWVPRRSNSYGALAAGAHPELLPGWRSVSASSDAPSAPGLGVAEMLREASQGRLDSLWLVGADVLADVPDARLGADALAGASFVVTQDVQRSPLLELADLALPAAAFVERDGTVTDWEGRRQPVHAATDPPGAARADYAILAESARRLGRNIGCRTAADVAAELNPFLDAPAPRIMGAAPDAAPEVSGDDLRLLTYRLLYDDGSRIRRTGGIRELTPGAFAELHPNDAERAAISDGDEIRVSSAHGSITTHAQISKGVREGVVFVPWSQWGVSAQALVAWDDPTPSLRLERA